MKLRCILRPVIIVSFLVFIAGFSLGFAQDKVVAIVNNDVISQKDLNDFINFMRVQFSAEYKGEELENKIQSVKLDLLSRLIEDKLILQEAKNQKIIIDESRIKARIDEIRSRAGSDAELQRSLKQQGLVQADLEAKIREQLLMYSVIDFKIRSKIIVNPSEVTEFYKNNTGEFISLEQREFESVSVDSEALAKRIYDALNGGLPIEAVSQKYNVQVNKFTIGKEEGLKKEISNAIFGLSLNEVSRPVNIENIFYIFKLNKIIPPRQQTLDEVKEVIHNYLFERKMKERLGEWINELKKHSYIKILSS